MSSNWVLKATKNICCEKRDGTVDPSIGSRNFAQFARTLKIMKGQVGLKSCSKQ